MKPFFQFLVSCRLSLKSDSQETVFHVLNDRNYKPEHYDCAVDMFLMEFPNGDICKHACRVDGYQPHKRLRRPRKKKSQPEIVPLTSSSESSASENQEKIAPRLSDISSDEWTTSFGDKSD